MAPLWEVVGGADKGGILVRAARELGSPALPTRLSTGAVVRELELAGDRLHYRLAQGSGPEEGWVSIKISSKDLLVRGEERPAAAATPPAAPVVPAPPPAPAAPPAAPLPAAPSPAAPSPAAPSPAAFEPPARAAVPEAPPDDGEEPPLEAPEGPEAPPPEGARREGAAAVDAPAGDVAFDDDDDGGGGEALLPETPVVEAPAEAPPAEEAGAVVVGARVEIRGLKSRADLNGRRGSVVLHDPDSGRFEVRIEGPADERIRCKPENLAVVVQKHSPSKVQGDEAFKEGRNDRAVELYRRALEEDAQGDAELAATIHSNMSAAYAKKGDHQRSLQAADEAVRLRPLWAKGHSRKGLSLLNLGRHSEAQASYIKAVKCDPTTDGYLAGLRQATEQLCKGTNEVNRQREAELQKAKGNEAMKAGQVSLAIAYYTTSLAILLPVISAQTQQHAAVYASNRSACFAKLQQWTWAQADAEEAKKFNPRWFKAHLRSACALLGQGHAEHAYKTYLHAATLDNGYQEAMREAQRTLWQIPYLQSPLAKRRMQRFSEDAQKLPGACRIFAISDVHIDHGPSVVPWAEGISATEFKNDILLVAGDLGDTFNAIKRGLVIFKKKFRRVFYVPGNHDMWIRPNTDDSTKKKFQDSICKLLAMYDLCDAIGAEMMPAEVMKNVYVVPMLAWWSCTFCRGDPRPDDCVYDSFCKWPMGEEGAHKYFLQWNDVFIRKIEQQQKQRGTNGEVISFSHFLPTDDLPCGGAPVKASGCLELEPQIRRIAGQLHIFGHTHLNMVYNNGIRYQQHSLMGPEYGHGHQAKFLKCFDGRLLAEPRSHTVY